MRANGAFIDTGVVHTYYEASGTGEPVVLLHGGMCTAETFDAQTTALAEHYRVYLPERRGHGRTPDVPGPLTYDIMATDTVAFIEGLNLSAVNLVGWSDGAAIGLLVAWRRPDLVTKLVYIGQKVTTDGLKPSFKPCSTVSTSSTCRPCWQSCTPQSRPTAPSTLSTYLID